MEALARQQVSSANAQSNELGALQRHLRETELTMDNLNRDKSILEESLRDEKSTSQKVQVRSPCNHQNKRTLKGRSHELEEYDTVSENTSFGEGTITTRRDFAT